MISALVRNWSTRTVLSLVAIFAITATSVAYWTASGSGVATGATGTVNPPTSVIATATPGSSTVGVSWTAPVASAGTLEGYHVFRTAQPAGSPQPACGGALITVGVSCNDSSVANGDYKYTVRAEYGGWTATSSASNQVNVEGDTVAPTTTATGSPAANGAGWNNANVTVALAATDNVGGSGVKQITYSASGAQTISSTVVSAASTSVSITTEGTTTISFAAEDNSGNVETTKTKVVKLDKTAPTVTINPGGPANGAGWYKAAVTFTASGADSGSGGVTCGSPTTYSGPDTATAFVTMNCTDAAGNVGTNGFSFKYDATAPSVTVVPARTNPDSNGWYNAPVAFSAGGTDATSLVASCQGDLTYSTPDGSALTVSRTCTDNAGNVGTGTSAIFKFDDTNPTVNSVTAARGADVAGWYNAPVTFTASGTDPAGGSGIGSCESTSYTTPESATATATRTCTDNAGNVGTGNSAAFKFDDTNPSVTTSASRLPDSNGWYNAAVTFTATGTDATSGINAGTCQSSSYSTPDSATASAARTCADIAGNVGTGTTSFKFDNTNPSFSLTMAAPTTGTFAAGLIGSVVWFNDCHLNGGFRFVNTVSDVTSGPGSSNYPALSASRWTGHADETVIAPSGGPFASSDYSFQANNCTGGKVAVPAGSHTITAADAAGNTAAQAVTFSADGTEPTVNALLVNSAGTGGQIEKADSVELTYSDTMDATSFCSTWTNATTTQTLLGTATVSVSAGDVMSVSSSACTFRFGTVTLAANYNNSANVMSFTTSTVSWNPTTKKLTITLGDRSGGVVNSIGPNSTPVYTRNATLFERNLAQLDVVAGPQNGTSSRF